MQIFFPYSLQQYPNEFPGEDPRDCPRNVNKEQSVVISHCHIFSWTVFAHFAYSRM